MPNAVGATVGTPTLPPGGVRTRLWKRRLGMQFPLWEFSTAVFPLFFRPPNIFRYDPHRLAHTTSTRNCVFRVASDPKLVTIKSKHRQALFVRK